MYCGTPPTSSILIRKVFTKLKVSYISKLARNEPFEALLVATHALLFCEDTSFVKGFELSCSQTAWSTQYSDLQWPCKNKNSIVNYYRWQKEIRDFFLQIRDEMTAEHGEGVLSANMIVALFLIANGADMYMKNNNGQSPTSLCPSDSISLLRRYSERK